MNEDYRMEEAIIDEQDRVQEILKPYREEYARDLWNDPQMVSEAITEALNSKRNQQYINALRCSSITGEPLREFINGYFMETAEEQYKTLEDL